MSCLSLSTGVSNTCLSQETKQRFSHFFLARGDMWRLMAADVFTSDFRTSFASSHASAVCCLKLRTISYSWGRKKHLFDAEIF